MMAVFVFFDSKWHQLTEYMKPSEAEEYEGYYKKWFPSERFQVKQYQQ